MEDRVELLAVIAADADSSLAERARTVLVEIPLEEFLTGLGRVDCDPHLFHYCAQHLGSQKGVADALAKNPACSIETVTHLASHLTFSGIQALLDDLDRLSSSSALVAALATSQDATVQQRDLLQEMLQGAAAPEEVEKAVADAEPDVEKRQTLLQRISKMNVVERIRLAFRGNREERLALIRDPNKIVQRSVMQSPRLTDKDVEAFSAMTTVSSEVFRAISISRVFLKNYTIVRNLVTNPKTPLDISMHLLPRLTPMDLKLLCSNKNVPETLRSMAVKLQRQRTARPTQSE